MDSGTGRRTEIYLRFRLFKYFEASASQHCFETWIIGNPPIRSIAAIFIFDKMHFRETSLPKDSGLVKRIVGSNGCGESSTTQHRLHDQFIASDVLTKKIQCQQR